MKHCKLLRMGSALVLAATLFFSPANLSFAASDDDVIYDVGGISANGYLIDDDDNYIDFDEAVTGPAADSDLRVPYGKTIYFPLMNTGTNGNYDSLVRVLERAKDTLKQEESRLATLKSKVDSTWEILDAQIKDAQNKPSAAAEKAGDAVALLDRLARALEKLDAWAPGSTVDSGPIKDEISDQKDRLVDEHNIVVADNAALYTARNEQLRLTNATVTVKPEDMPGFTDWVNAVAAHEAQQKVVGNAKQAVLDAQAAVDNATTSQDGYPFVHESQAVRNVKIKTDWDEGKSYIDSLSITRKRYKSSPYPAPSDARKYAYFLAIEMKDRENTSTSTRDASGTVKLRKSSGRNQFDYDEVQIDVDFEIGFNHPEDSNVIPIDPALFEPDEDFDEDTDEEFEFEADDDSYFIANTKNQKKIVLGMNTDYDDDIADQYEYASLSFWNGNGASFNRSGYLYLRADEDDYLYSIEKDQSLTLLHADYDRYEDCFVIRTRTLGRYLTSDVKLREVASTTEDDHPDITVIYDVGTGVNYNPKTGGYGADSDEGWTAPAPANAAVYDAVLTRDGMLARPERAMRETASSEPSASSAVDQEISATPAAALTEHDPLSPLAPADPVPGNKPSIGRNKLILYCVVAAELTVALTSLACYFFLYRRRRG